MEQPEGFEKKGPKGEKLVYKLRKSLCDLKESGCNWNNILQGYLLDEGFEQLLADPCVYYRQSDNMNVVIIVWVDDIIIGASVSSDNNILDSGKSSLSERFKMKDLGKLSWFLGIELVHGKNYIKMNQTKYMAKIPQKLKMAECKPKATPSDLVVNKVKDADSTE